jgi:serine protease Do
MPCRSIARLASRWFLVLALASLPIDSRAQDDRGEEEQAVESSRAKLYEALHREVAGLERQSNVLKLVAKLVRPTVVHIEADKTDPAALKYNRKSHIEEAGSGCLVKIGERVYVITNRHVIKAADNKNIKIRLADGRELNPTRKWEDQETDIAVMAVNAQGLVPARLGNSDDLEIGDFVIAVGSPFGLSHSITFGIVSATGRRDLQLGDNVRFQDFIQTDAAINPGNSGGPLINLRGEVVGMNTAIASSSGGNEGIGFSIPINMVMIIAKQLVERNSVVRAFLGVALDSGFDPATAISVGLSRPRGTRVKDVTPGSPAGLAKLQKGDVILEYGGVRVDNDSHLIYLVSLTEIGREVPLTIFRDQKIMNVMVKLAAAPSQRADTGRPANERPELEQRRQR